MLSLPLTSCRPGQPSPTPLAYSALEITRSPVSSQKHAYISVIYQLQHLCSDISSKPDILSRPSLEILKSLTYRLLLFPRLTLQSFQASELGFDADTNCRPVRYS
ncbi:hypothetical protein H2248_001257 [Termitomyces sp. 'cryptogamus']|nr:hypothetical protein H2248_001257 [Termitomyces sp. 'cryptogamus']